MDALLAGLRAKKWERRLRRNVYPVPCHSELAWAGNKNASLLALALSTAPRQDFKFAQLNRSIAMGRHRDKYNLAGSLLLLLGDFEGGALCFDDGRRLTDTGVWIPFDGHEEHWVEPFVGERFSIILFNNPPLERRLWRLHRAAALKAWPSPVSSDGEHE